MIANANPAAINPGPVRRAGLAPSIVAAQTTMPSMRGTLAGWLKPMLVGIVTEDIQKGGDRDGQTVATVRDVRTSGVLQAGDEKLDIKAGGQRSWAKGILHVYPDLNVQTDTRLKIDGKFYRVIEKKDYTAQGYIRYVLQEDYVNV